VPTRRPRVLIVGAFPPPERHIFGGMVTSCAALMRSSLPTRVDVIEVDSTQISNPPPPFLSRLLLAIPRFFRFVDRFERTRPDVIVLFVALGASVIEKGAMAWYARCRAVPAIMFPRGGGLMVACEASAFTMAWVRAAFRGARRVFCQSPHWQRFAQDHLGFSAADTPVIPNWTATEDLLNVGRRRLAADSESRPDDLPVRLVFVGWLDFEKGLRELITACETLAPRLRFRLDLVGEGNSSAWARERVQASGLGDRVTFRGWLTGADLVQAFAQADVLVLPSWAEGLPNAMIEAMAAGLAVVVTRVGSVPDVVTDGRDALLVPIRDTEALTAALTHVITDADTRRRLGAAAHQQAATLFDAESSVGLMVEQFHALARISPAGIE
jgi:glycosyltransferase involved in cell wall biosynthesis